MGCVVLELLLPVSPIIIEFVLKKLLSGLQPFTLRHLATTGMTLPLILFIRTAGWSKNLMGILWGVGAILFAASICMDSPAYSEAQRTANVTICYVAAGIGIALTGGFRFASEGIRLFVRTAQREPEIS